MHLTNIKNLQMFSDLSLDDQNYLLETSEECFYPAGSIVIYEGDKPEFLYLILKGCVKVVLQHTNGRETLLKTLKAGDYFGEMSAFDYLTRSATVVTEEDSEFLAISQERFTNVVMRNPEIAVKIIRNMSLRLREANEMISILNYLNVKAKVAKTLLKLSKSEGSRSKNGCIYIPRPPLKDLASMSGTSRETVSRILNGFSKKGFLELSKQRIVINGEAHLVDEAEKIDYQ